MEHDSVPDIPHDLLALVDVLLYGQVVSGCAAPLMSCGLGMIPTVDDFSSDSRVGVVNQINNDLKVLLRHRISRLVLDDAQTPDNRQSCDGS